MQVPTEPPLPSQVALVHPLLRELHSSPSSLLFAVPLEIATYYLQPYCGLPCGSVMRSTGGYIGDQDPEPNPQYTLLTQPRRHELDAPVEFGGFYRTHCGSWITYGTTRPNTSHKCYERIQVHAALDSPDQQFVHSLQFQIPEGMLAAEWAATLDVQCTAMDQAPDGTTVMLRHNIWRGGTHPSQYKVWMFDPQYKLVASYAPTLQHASIGSWRTSVRHTGPRILEMHALCDQQIMLLVAKPLGVDGGHVPFGCTIITRTTTAPIWFALDNYDHGFILTTAANPCRSTIYVMFNRSRGWNLVYAYDTRGKCLRTLTVCPLTESRSTTNARPFSMLVDDQEHLLILLDNGDVVLNDGMDGEEIAIGKLEPALWKKNDPITVIIIQPRLDSGGNVWSMDRANGSLTRHHIQWLPTTSFGLPNRLDCAQNKK